MVHASVDRSALAGLLLKQRMLFSLHMMSLEVQLMLHSFGCERADRRRSQSWWKPWIRCATQLRALAAVAQPAASAA